MQPADRIAGKWVFVVTAVVIAASFVGFLVGTAATSRKDGTESPAAAAKTRAEGASAVPVAAGYSDMDTATRGPNRNWPGTLSEQIPDQETEPRQFEPDERDVVKLASLEFRDSRRAFNGAPPVIPHPVEQRDTGACMACHRNGLILGDQIAPKLSHAVMDNCTQCHAPPSDGILPVTFERANAFEGDPAPFEGPRAYNGAPPVIPHSTHMRSDCLSCHGPAGHPGLQSSHPERLSCRQCHGQSAVLNQQPAIRTGSGQWTSLLGADISRVSQ